MKNKIIIIFVIAFFIFLLILLREPSESQDIVKDKLVLNYSNLLFNYKIIRYPSSVEITPSSEGNMNVEIVTDPWNLNFGGVPGNGSSIKRYIGITNLKEKYNKIKIKPYGNISLLVNFSKNDFTLKENESAVVEVGLYTDTAKSGNYSGEIDVIIKVPKYDFLSILLWFNEKIVFDYNLV